MKLNLDMLLRACAEDSLDDGIRIDAELEPISGPGGPVKPAVYEGGKYQTDRRWASPEDDQPTDVIVIDNVPSQANRLEEALRQQKTAIGIPELVLELSGIRGLPVHLPQRLSSLQFPHRNADAYLRDSQLEGEDFAKTDLGKAIFSATPWNCGALMSWFPQALLYGFWQSHLGKKGIQTKHARAWVSEIVGWKPAASDTSTMGLKGDPLNLSVEDMVQFDPNNQKRWNLAKDGKIPGGTKKKLSEIGHGQVPFMKQGDASASSVSFARISQRATVSFAQLRRVSLAPGKESRGEDIASQNAAARALLIALGLFAHVIAFGKGFALRSGAEMRPSKTEAMWLSSSGDVALEIGSEAESRQLLLLAQDKAASEGVPLDGWRDSSLILSPKQNLANAIQKTWPELSD